MKLAVIGAGSTYTPELVSRARAARRSTSSRCTDIDAERLEVVGGLAERMLDRAGFDGRALADERPRRGGRRRRLRPLPDPRRRAGGAAARRDGAARAAAASARRRPAPAASRRRCAQCPSCSRSPSACASARRRARGSSTSRTRSGSSRARCSTQGHRAVGLCNVAIAFQRLLAELLGVEPERVRRRPGRAQPPDVGARACGSTAATSCPSCSREHGDELADEIELPRSVLDDLGALPSYYLHYFYAHDRVLAEQQDGVPRAQTVAEIERELLELYRDPASTEKPALLEQRGGAFYSEAAVGLVRSLRRPATARARGRRAQQRHARRARRRRRRRGARARRRGGACAAAAGAARARAARARRSTSPRTSG